MAAAVIMWPTYGDRKTLATRVILQLTSKGKSEMGDVSLFQSSAMRFLEVELKDLLELDSCRC